MKSVEQMDIPEALPNGSEDSEDSSELERVSGCNP
jgi:hypothetical protein